MRVDSPSKELLRNSSEAASGSGAVPAVAPNASAQPMVNGVDGSEASPTSVESVLDKIRELGIDFFSEDFEGVTKASTLCLSCETITNQEETMLDLSVPITENMETHELDESFIQVSQIGALPPSRVELIAIFAFSPTEFMYHTGTISRRQ